MANIAATCAQSRMESSGRLETDVASIPLTSTTVVLSRALSPPTTLIGINNTTLNTQIKANNNPAPRVNFIKTSASTPCSLNTVPSGCETNNSFNKSYSLSGGPFNSGYLQKFIMYSVVFNHRNGLGEYTRGYFFRYMIG